MKGCDGGLAADRTLRPSTGLAALGVAATVAVGFVLFRTHEVPPSTTPATASRSVVLDDGSEITPTTATTAIQVAEQTPTRTTVRLRSGSAQFRVRHDSRRLFRVDTGAVEIEDLGTVFRVAHEAAGRVRVAVSEGRVAVLYPASQVRTELGAGESRTFDPLPVTGDAPQSARETPKPSTSSSAIAAGPPGAPRARATEEPAALLLAADLARRSNHPEAAVGPLRRLVEKYPKDPRAPSAAFTLGWVLLTDLGRPREAAAAFAEAERNAPRGMLAEDAASRVAEAWQKSGRLSPSCRSGTPLRTAVSNRAAPTADACPRRRTLTGTLLALSLVLMGGDDQTPAVVTEGPALAIDACIAVDQATVRQVMELEIPDARLLPASVSVRCVDGAQEIRIRRSDLLDQEDVRTIHIAPTADDDTPAERQARSRELALAIAEFVRWPGPSARAPQNPPAPLPPPPAPVPAPAIATASDVPEGRWQLGILCAFEHFSRGQNLMGA